MNIDYEQLKFLDPKLRKLGRWLEDETGLTFTVTSYYREGDPGVHGQIPVRGQDLRMRSRVVGEAIQSLINDRWVYDPNRPGLKCCLLHGEGANMHLHLQVHPNTKKH